MMGPRTLEGGYSSSQYISSTMLSSNDCLGMNATDEGEFTLDPAGAKAETAARITARITKLSLAILNEYVIFLCVERETIMGESVKGWVDNYSCIGQPTPLDHANARGPTNENS